MLTDVGNCELKFILFILGKDSGSKNANISKHKHTRKDQNVRHQLIILSEKEYVYVPVNNRIVTVLA